MDPNEISKWTTSFQHFQISYYMDASSLAILCFDYLLTLSLEVEYVWKARCNYINVLYIIMRYLPFLSMISIIFVDTPGRTPGTCLTISFVYSFSVVFGICVSEAILTLRIWAIYSRSRTMGVILLVFFLGTSITLLVNIGIFLGTVKYIRVPLPNAPTCFVAAGSRRLIINWILLAVYDAFQCALLAYQAYKAFKFGGRSELLGAIYTNGIIYYVNLMALSITSVILILNLPPEFLRLTSGPTHVIHASLTARVVLHVRHLAAKRALTISGDSVVYPVRNDLPFMR
ncbi:hypothetical protein AMATHDRAFT_62381 [Amanita thiersii Skay4041]|uniref:DUF6533 domain-containing protein n=1 Tax=Amanita thiersii Skay4041 TaxID=703135 RepID=A0A2A9NIE1_9AGAR|nr:hypothetical protein AMATHDRAFT_62381 [Amanita thiersii Skay4041]